MNAITAVTQVKEGVLLQVHVTPGSSQQAFPAGYNQWRNCLEVKVRSEAQDDKANTELREVIARYFHIPKQDVVVVSGQKSRQKTILVQKTSLDSVYKKLRESLHE